MICVSIFSADYSACLALARQFECVELRLDAADFSEEEISNLVSAANKAIITYRPGKVSDDVRLECLKTAINAGAYMVDIELDAPESYRIELGKYARSRGSQVILSHHDFEFTPSLPSLKTILEECFSRGADVAKIACQVNSMKDNAHLLSLYSLEGRKVILGMGDLGRITRVAALYLGAEFSFASPDNGKSTAAGQLSYSEFQSVQYTLNLKK